MSDTVQADEKKSPSKKESYDEKVTVREWTGSKFLDGVENVLAFRAEISGKQVVYVWFAGRAFSAPPKSEIVDNAGVTWVVATSKKADTYWLCYVTKKP